MLKVEFNSGRCNKTEWKGKSNRKTERREMEDVRKQVMSLVVKYRLVEMS